MQFQVTEQHITDGLAGQPESCPVALSMYDSGFPHILVGSTSVTLDWSNAPDKELGLPDRVIRRIRYFDRTGKMKPFGFELPV